VEEKTIAQIQSEGYDALINALGPEDAVRFIRSFDHGSGASTKERKKLLKKKSVKQIGKEILAVEKSPWVYSRDPSNSNCKVFLNS